MYERLVWTLPASWRKPAKAFAGVMLRAIATLVRLPSPLKRFLARAFGFRYRAVVDALRAIPEAQISKTVLFLSMRPHTREAKLAEAAKLAGWKPILIYTEKLNFNADDFFYFHAQVGGLLQLLLISWLFPGPLIHLFAPDGAQAYLLCVTKIRPLLLDLNDTCKSHALQSLPRVWEQCERDAIRAADGMTHRDLRVKFHHEFYQYPLSRQNLLCVDLLPTVTPHPLISRRNGEIRVVSVGWVGKGDSSILRTIRALCDHQIHVHMYTNPFQNGNDPELEDYQSLQRTSKYFHFEEPVFGQAYWDQLSRYDFGLSVSEPLVFGEMPTSVTMDSLRGAGSSRLMDYLLLGLGVIISPGLEFQWFLARRYAPVVVPVTREFLKNPAATLRAALERKAATAGKNLATLTIKGTSRRLGEFYDKVSRTR